MANKTTYVFVFYDPALPRYVIEQWIKANNIAEITVDSEGKEIRRQRPSRLIPNDYNLSQGLNYLRGINIFYADIYYINTNPSHCPRMWAELGYRIKLAAFGLSSEINFIGVELP